MMVTKKFLQTQNVHFILKIEVRHFRCMNFICNENLSSICYCQMTLEYYCWQTSNISYLQLQLSLKTQDHFTLATKCYNSHFFLPTEAEKYDKTLHTGMFLSALCTKRKQHHKLLISRKNCTKTNFSWEKVLLIFKFHCKH